MGKVCGIIGGELVEGGGRVKKRSGVGGVWGGVWGEEKEWEWKCIEVKMGEEGVGMGYVEGFGGEYEGERGEI